MAKLPYLKTLAIAAYANLVLRGQKGYPIAGYDIIILTMQSITFIENYTDPASIYYVPDYKVTTIIDSLIRELSQL